MAVGQEEVVNEAQGSVIGETYLVTYDEGTEIHRELIRTDVITGILPHRVRIGVEEVSGLPVSDSGIDTDNGV